MYKKGLLPRLAAHGIFKNGSTYLPYIGISIFAIFTFFVFDLIINNDVMNTIPRASYAKMLMMVGFVLLGIIMVPFLYYTNSFLIKRRKKEIGLYSILGMEKKHIGIMLLIETLFVYVVVVICAILLGLLFSKLLFLLLLNLAKLPVDVTLTISGIAIRDTLIFYAVISAINLFSNLVQVGKSKPVELLGESRKGEKEPKHILLWTIVGVILLGSGYYLAVTSQVDAMIFTNFFLAVFLVIMGTHFLFTSGSISFLRFLKKNKKFYYHSENFISVSGMIYRMKKNAASLVNICIFATMVIITLICTVSLYLGIPGIQKFMYPYDVQLDFWESSFEAKEDFEEEMQKLAREENVTIADQRAYTSITFSVIQKDGRMVLNDGTASYQDYYQLSFLTLDSFHSLESEHYELKKDEVLIYSTGPDYGRDMITLLNDTYRVKEELKASIISPKSVKNTFSAMYYMIVPDNEIMAQIVSAYGVDWKENLKYSIEMNLQGEEEKIEVFIERLKQLSSGYDAFVSYDNNVLDSMDMEAMYGGLLFIGIFFGTIFMLCLLIIMYYKQITEGFEDQMNFEIMQKVGMSDLEVKRTIKKQILQVFFVPLVGAIIHTICGMFMVINLMATLNFFQIGLIIACSCGICVVFALVYGVCYNRTAKAYYKIVKRMA